MWLAVLAFAFTVAIGVAMTILLLQPASAVRRTGD
jgi:hypothetical protein